jgi:hypothetical protein
MVRTTTDEQFRKLILLNNEHDLILFKPVERKQMQCSSWCKTNKYIETCKYEFLIIVFVEQHAAQHSITQRQVKKNSNQLCDFWI